MSITLTLPNANHYSVQMDRTKFLLRFGDTIIGDTMMADPTAEQIEILQPEITPEILDFLKIITESDENPGRIFDILDIRDAFRYLGGKLLPLFLHSAYDIFVNGMSVNNSDQKTLPFARQLRQFAPIEYSVDSPFRAKDRDALMISLYNPVELEKYYRYFVSLAILHDWPEVLQYVGSLVAPDRTRVADQEAFRYLPRFENQISPINIPLVRSSEVALVRYFISRGAVPYGTIPENNIVLINAINQNHPELVRYLLTVPGIDPTAPNMDALISAINYGGGVETFTVLYSDSRFRARFDQRALIKIITGP